MHRLSTIVPVESPSGGGSECSCPPSRSFSTVVAAADLFQMRQSSIREYQLVASADLQRLLMGGDSKTAVMSINDSRAWHGSLFQGTGKSVP